MNRYTTEETFEKLFLMGWNEIVGNIDAYQKAWNNIMAGDDCLLKCKTKLLMEKAAEGPLHEFDPKRMIMVIDYIIVFEDGRLQIKFYDETGFEVETE